MEQDAALPARANRVVVSVNPKAGSREAAPRVDHLVGLLRQGNLEVTVLTDLNRVSAAANQGLSEGTLRAVVAAGGDGTAAEILNRTEPGVPLAVLALGTENLLAKYLGLAAPVERVATAIIDGVTRRFDAGLAGSRLFLLMASCGFDAEVIERLHASRQGHISQWNYAKPIAQAIRSYQYPELTVYCDPDDSGAVAPRVIKSRWAFLFNLPCYARGLPLAPRADGSDGLFDLCTFRRGSLWRGLGYLAQVVCGRHERLADCTTARVRRVRVESAERVPYQLDGDPGGVLPLDVQIVPKRATLIVGATGK